VSCQVILQHNSFKRTQRILWQLLMLRLHQWQCINFKKFLTFGLNWRAVCALCVATCRFERADFDHSGTLSKREFAVMYAGVLCEKAAVSSVYQKNHWRPLLLVPGIPAGTSSIMDTASGPQCRPSAAVLRA